MSASDQQVPHRRTVVSYVQRGERMTTGQQRAWDRYWEEFGHDISELPEGPLDTTGWFGRTAPLVLEIGSGMGETTARLAADQPERDHLAVEVYKPGLAQLLARAEKLGVDNLRLLRGDATVLLREHIPEDTLSEVRVFFPDPWPKKRHHKRRLVQPGFVALVASRLRPGGVLHLATDWVSYAEQMMEVCTAESRLRNRHADQPGGWAPRPEWRPVTKFENRAHAEGREVHDLIFERV
ncbi:tRNA (guanosine(46)-N7)-methyltransferase TrmB [Actinopolyspora erythraea]|uniref:tRNA (guanine-N(7)-)-methyltransferase n=1 Tax=Actinopolyspora erythraea TaxID=414996 RepID=A0A099D9H4_9ACTN|nr:tRNA (guanosine(46)-N7)-methyltransferase TrmB [Actinopolyspora erythraea]ASU80497.1 tRNA (guanosine(46)-N7)-methyltransferase TrmB [Actinopolyspora erythraea]KGI82833.1 tRNA (guanine-N7)-methyltransferase [Actinopolyspora erythraea]